jgi:hypothetical protein
MGLQGHGEGGARISAAFVSHFIYTFRTFLPALTSKGEHGKSKPFATSRELQDDNPSPAPSL